eukprot:GHRR01006250.1.p1 GENE.GHRR01006250.1~~GHRR01006250.1.p1  ORF type:complete len:628 (+),score=189.15 GHRR01006250.1:1990-3873(+)
MGIPRSLLLIIVSSSGLLVQCQAAVTGSACGPQITFFPAGSEDDNLPSAWTLTAQKAAGNTALGQLYTVVLTSQHNKAGFDVLAVPELQVMPIHMLLTKGANSLALQCLGYAATARHLLQTTSPGTTPIGALASGSSTGNVAGNSDADILDSGIRSIYDDDYNTADVYTMYYADGAVAQGKVAVDYSMAGTWEAGSWDEYSSSDILAETAGYEPSSSSSSSGARKLAQAPAVTTPARFKVTYQLNSTATVDLGEFRNTSSVPRINLTQLANMTDGYYCMTIKVTILAYTGLYGSTAVPVKDLYTTTQVCFYKLDNKPTANVHFTTCTDTLGVTLSNMSLPPIALTPGSSELLYKPVYHFTADLNRTRTGDWPSDEQTKSLSNWLVINSTADVGKAITWVPDAAPVEGWYNIQVLASLTSAYPSLIALGTASIDRYNGEGVPEDILDELKLAETAIVPTPTVLGVQHAPTKFNYLNGPDSTGMAVNSDITFDWDFEGVGLKYCWIDGLKYSNAGENSCVPPLTFALPNTKNHTLTVTMRDACGTNLTVEATYGTWGYALTKVPNTTGAITLDAGTVTGGTFDLPASTGVLKARTTTSAAGFGHLSRGLLMWWFAMLAVVVGWAFDRLL